MNSKVSIIIPIYKTEKYLEQCVESCMLQTYTNIEIILIDDGSPDNAGLICDSLASRDNRIIVIHKKNEGVSVARNIGIDKSTGEYIVFLDSDDWLEYNMIEILVSYTDERTDLVVSGSIHHYNEKRFCVAPIECTLSSNEEIISSYVDRRYSLFLEAPWAKLYRTSLLRMNNIKFDNDMKLGEDLIFNLRLIPHYNKIIMSNKSLYNFRRITYDKSSHYNLNDIEYQWNNNLKMYKYYISVLHNIIHQKDIGKMYAFYARAIKAFIDTTLFSGSSINNITIALKKISQSNEFYDLKNVKLRDLNDIIEKIVFICCKIRCWHMLCIVFKLKHLVHRIKVLL